MRVFHDVLLLCQAHYFPTRLKWLEYCISHCLRLEGADKSTCVDVFITQPPLNHFRLNSLIAFSYEQIR